jgi:hypothetical protein
MICGKLGMKLFLLGVVASTVAYAQDAVKIAPENPKYLWFRGKPLAVLIRETPAGGVLADELVGRRFWRPALMAILA